jgi:site-specific DNA recombinase
MLAIYTRLSKEDGDSTSIEHQLREAKQFAKEKGLEYKIYNEGEGLSGGLKIDLRPQFSQLLRDMQSGEINKVYTRNQNRLERNTFTWATFLKLVFELNIEVYYQGHLQNLDTPQGKMMANIMSSFNAYTIDNQSYLTKRSLLDNVLEGKAHGKSTPLGYKADDRGYIVIDETEKPIVEQIYKMCLAGKGSTTIKHYLNKNEVPTRYNKGKGTFKIKNRITGKITNKKKSEVKWSDRQVQSILKNPMYKGKRKWNDQFVDCPAIFNDLYWEKVQQQYKLNGNSKNTGKNVDHKYLLKGLLECNQCHRNYYGRTRISKKDNYYMCSSKRYKDLDCTNRSINIDVLDKIVWNVMYQDNLYDKILNSFKNGDASKRKTELIENLSTNQNKFDNLSKEHKKAIELVIKGLADENEILESKNRIASQTLVLNEIIEKDREEYERLNNETKILNEVELDFNRQQIWNTITTDHKTDIENRIKQAYRKASVQPSYNEKKKLLNKYINRIFVDYDNSERIYSITFDFNLPIKDEVHLTDANYLFTYDAAQNSVDELDLKTASRYTEKTKNDTITRLRAFS